jgi:hypothetical protein
MTYSCFMLRAFEVIFTVSNPRASSSQRLRDAIVATNGSASPDTQPRLQAAGVNRRIDRSGSPVRRALQERQGLLVAALILVQHAQVPGAQKRIRVVFAENALPRFERALEQRLGLGVAGLPAVALAQICDEAQRLWMILSKCALLILKRALEQRPGFLDAALHLKKQSQRGNARYRDRVVLAENALAGFKPAPVKRLGGFALALGGVKHRQIEERADGLPGFR